jgi:hypothetical protein
MGRATGLGQGKARGWDCGPGNLGEKMSRVGETEEFKSCTPASAGATHESPCPGLSRQLLRRRPMGVAASLEAVVSDRGVTTPTTHRWYPVAAGGRALNENQHPGHFLGEGVRR